MLRGGSTTSTRLLRTGLAAAALGAAVAAAPAQATVVNVTDGHNISVFHNLDMVMLGGSYPAGANMKVEVVRGGHVIGTASGQITDLDPEAGVELGLEVNHEEATCWTDATPDIIPGDTVRVTELTADAADVDPVEEIVIDDVAIDKGPYVLPNGDVAVRGHARMIDGTPVSRAELEGSAEVLNTSSFRGAPQVRILDAAKGTFELWHDPSDPLDEERTNHTEESRRATLLQSDWVAGHGHVNENALETQLYEGSENDVNQPALGCEAAPGESNRITAASTTLFGSVAPDVLVDGTSFQATRDAAPAEVTGVSIVATDSAGVSTPAVVSPTDLTGDPTAWTATILGAELDKLAAGDVTITPTFTLAGGGTIGGKPLTIVKDTSVPAPAVPSRAQGTYNIGAFSLGLSAGEGQTITYRTDGKALGTAGDRTYTGPIFLNLGTHRIAVRVTNAAGNFVDSVLTYTVNPVPAPPQQPRQQQPAPAVQLPQPVIVQPSAFRPAAPSLRLSSKRVKLRTARRKGLSASLTAPNGARVVVARLYRLSGAKRTLVSSKRVRVRAGRRYSVKFAGRKLKAALYLVEVRAGRSSTALGAPRIARLRVIR